MADDPFNMQPVVSTQIAEMGFDPDAKQIKVVFVSNGAMYIYYDCTQDDFDQIVNAPSVGSAFNASIKYGKRYARVG